MSFQYEEVLCPDCNERMIPRKGKYGIFWGCRNYPKCTGTRDSEGRSKAQREEWKAEQAGKSDVSFANEDIPDQTERVKTSFNRNVK